MFFRLRLLDIEENSIGKRGAVAIAGSLLAGGNTSLTSLNLGGDIHEFGNSAIAAVGPVGAGALADALKVENCQLVSLNLDETRIGADGATALAEGLLAESALEELGARSGIDRWNYFTPFGSPLAPQPRELLRAWRECGVLFAIEGGQLRG